MLKTRSWLEYRGGGLGEMFGGDESLVNVVIKEGVSKLSLEEN